MGGWVFLLEQEVGDGTTSVVVLAGELLQQSKEFVEENVAPNLIVKGFRTACELAKAKVDELAVKVDTSNPAKMREMLELFAGTSMNSKLIAGTKVFFSRMVVDAVLHLDDDLDASMIGVKKEKGGSLEDSFLVQGVAFKKTFSYAGFEQQPKYFEKPKVRGSGQAGRGAFFFHREGVPDSSSQRGIGAQGGEGQRQGARGSR